MLQKTSLTKRNLTSEKLKKVSNLSLNKKKKMNRKKMDKNNRLKFKRALKKEMTRIIPLINIKDLPPQKNINKKNNIKNFIFLVINNIGNKGNKN